MSYFEQVIDQPLPSFESSHGFIAEGLFSIKDDFTEDCELSCPYEGHDAHGVGNTLDVLLSGEGPFQKETEHYMRTGMA